MNWKTILGLVIAILLVALGAGFIRDSRIESDFPSVRAQSDETQIHHLLGEPSRVQVSCEAYDIQVAPDCDHVFIYRSIFYPLRSKYWLVFFNKNQRVTATSSELEP